MPTREQIAELVAFLPKFYAGNKVVVEIWDNNQRGFFSPAGYSKIVNEFFGTAGEECWADYQYIPESAALMLSDPSVIENADLAQIKTMLTYCVRGERFCTGHWAAMIEQRCIKLLLERLSEIYHIS